jgi:hypothetical protein
MLERDEEVLHVLEFQGSQRIMDRHGSHDTRQFSRTEGSRCWSDDVIRRQASLSIRCGAESSDRSIERTHLNEMEEARAQAIDRGKAKWQKYQQEAERYQKADRDTFENFKKIFTNKISNDPRSNVLYIKSNNDNSGLYENKIDVMSEKIIGEFNKHYVFCNSNKLNFSEIVFNQLRLAMEYLNKEISEFNLKSWYAHCIIDKETKETVKLFFPVERGKDGFVKEREKTFQSGTDAFIALAGTPTAQSKFYMLAQHPKAFLGKEVTSITVTRNFVGQIDIEYKFS